MRHICVVQENSLVLFENSTFLPALYVGKAIAAQKNTFHMRLELQKLVPSSRLINVPPKKINNK